MVHACLVPWCLVDSVDCLIGTIEKKETKLMTVVLTVIEGIECMLIFLQVM